MQSPSPEFLGVGEQALLYRRQFLLTPEPCAKLDHWPHAVVGSHHLYTHPDLGVATASSASGDVRATLVGFVIDPDHPEHSNFEILRSMIEPVCTSLRIASRLRSLSGRFVLLVCFPTDTLVFHDACGFRSVFYTSHQGQPVLATQPLLLRMVRPITCEERLFLYTASTHARTVINHWLPSGCSLYEDVQHLLPNHYLSLSTLQQTRYWPDTMLHPRPLEEVVVQVSELVCALMRAAHARFPLALAQTAGLDSRMLLAASKDIIHDVFPYTMVLRKLTGESGEVAIPKKLAQAFGYTHHALDCRRPIDAQFRDIYLRNTSPVHLHDWGEIAWGLAQSYPAERVSVKGFGSEIVRCFFYPSGVHEEITRPSQIVQLVPAWDELPFVAEQVSNWFDVAAGIAAEARLDLLDLFYWEHRMGSWGMQYQLEWDIIHETFMPLCNRVLVESMLSVPVRERSRPGFRLQKALIARLWPALLGWPFNPPDNSVRKKLVSILKRIENRLEVRNDGRKTRTAE